MGGVPSGRNPKQILAPVSRCCNVFVYRNWMEQDSERERFLWEELLMGGIQIKSGLLLHCVCLEIGLKENSKGNNNFANKPNFNQIREHAKITFQVNSFIEIKIKQNNSIPKFFVRIKFGSSGGFLWIRSVIRFNSMQNKFTPIKNCNITVLMKP